MSVISTSVDIAGATPPSPAPARKANHFVALDSWRGLCACMVAFFHFAAFSHLLWIDAVRNAYLFVDFFFVLSGFVIASNYTGRLQSGRLGVGQFMLVRLGRLYPLHLVTLLFFVLQEGLPLFVPALLNHVSSPPFSKPEEAMNTIVANLFLVHSLGLYDRVSWNFASWSISTEVYTYLLFAILLTRLSAVGTRTACLVAIVLLPAVLGALPRHTIEVALDYGLLRCAYGFAMGMLCWHAYTRLDAGGAAAKAPALAATVVEIVLVVAVVGFVGAAGRGPWSLLAPYVFGPTVLAFAFERGAVSRLLSSRPLVYIGMISYSIYMVHLPVSTVMQNVGRLVAGRTDWPIFRTGSEQFGPTLLIGDIYSAVFIGIVIAVSAVTYRWVEVPGRDGMKQWVARWAARRVSAGPSQQGAYDKSPVADRAMESSKADYTYGSEHS